MFTNSRPTTCVWNDRSGRTALLALVDTVGVSQLEDGEHRQAGFQALLQVPRADLVPHTLPFLLLGNSLDRILFHFRSTVLLAGNYHVVNTGLILRDLGDACSSFFDRSQILLLSFWQVLEEEGEAASQREKKPE